MVPCGLQAQPAPSGLHGVASLSFYPAGTLSSAVRISQLYQGSPLWPSRRARSRVCSSTSICLDCRDSIIYSAFCDRIGDAPVAIKVYNKARLSTSKLRAIKREAAMMIYMSRKK